MIRWQGLVALLAMLSGCSFRMTTVPSETARAALPFLKTGTTIRKEVIDRLGPPSYTNTEDRVIAYRMIRDGFGKLLVHPGRGRFGWEDIQFNLVLAFDEREVLQVFSLIQMKEGGPW